MTRPVLVLAAIPEEARPLRRALGGRTDILVAVTGDGAARAARATTALLVRYGPGLVVVAGFAGALTARSRRAEACLVREVRDGRGRSGPSADPAATARARRVGLPEAVLVDADRLVRTPDQRDRVRTAAGLAASDRGLVDLETHACARAIEAAGIPWIAVRAVTDTWDDRLPEWLETARTPDGGIRRGALVAGALLRPARFPALLRLGRRGRRAGRELSEAVRAVLDGIGTGPFGAPDAGARDDPEGHVANLPRTRSRA